MTQSEPQKFDQLWKKRQYRGGSDLFVKWGPTHLDAADLENAEIRVANENLVFCTDYSDNDQDNIANGARADILEGISFPCFLEANLELCQSEIGRSVRSTRNGIKFDTRVFQEESFASVVEPSVQIFCLTCHEVPTTPQIAAEVFVKCPRCDAVFCNIYCRDSNQTHKFECGTFFRRITDLEIACTIQMVFETMVTFASAEELLVYIENLVHDEITHGNVEQRKNVIQMQIPQNANDKISRYDCIMKLQNGEINKYRCYRVDIAIDLMEKIDSIQAYFQTPAQKRLLGHLAQHFFGILLENAWKFRLICGPNPQDALERRMIYPVGSYFNHSCAPDLLVTNEGNVMFLRSLYQIPAGEEVFVSYEFFYDDDTDSRQRHLKASWGFECACTRCNGHDVLENDRRIAKQVFDGANRRRRPNEMVNLSSLETKLRRIGNPRNGGMDLAYLLEYYNNY